MPFADRMVFLANLSAHMKSGNISEPRVCGHLIASTLFVGHLPLWATLEAVLMACDSHAIQSVELPLQWDPWTDCVCRKKTKNQKPSSANFRNVFTGHFPGKCWALESSQSLWSTDYSLCFPTRFFTYRLHSTDFPDGKRKPLMSCSPKFVLWIQDTVVCWLYGARQRRRGLK